jgi:multiple sugar transport system permease protein
MKRSLFALLVNAGLIVGAAFALFPLAWMVSVSFMPTGAASVVPPPILPASTTLANYQQLFAQQEMGRYFMNSLIVASSATFFSLLLNGAAGYAFAKLRFRGRERLIKFMLASLLIPAQVTMIPLFGMMKGLGLVNSYASVVVPAMTSIFGIFLVRQYALSIPNELLDAARIDGAGELRIFRSLVLPLLLPILVTLGIFTFLGTWNDFMWPLIVLSDKDMQTLPVALAGMSREHVQDYELTMAGSVITVTPVLLLFLALQRYYLRGILMGSVKG